MDKCNVVISELKKELKAILIDHKWYLILWYLNGLVVVKLFCAKCNKKFGGNGEEFTKTTNLFIT